MEDVIDGLPWKSHIINAELLLGASQIRQAIRANGHDICRHTRSRGDMKIQFRKTDTLLLWDRILEHTPAAIPIRNSRGWISKCAH